MSEQGENRPVSTAQLQFESQMRWAREKSERLSRPFTDGEISDRERRHLEALTPKRRSVFKSAAEAVKQFCTGPFQEKEDPTAIPMPNHERAYLDALMAGFRPKNPFQRALRDIQNFGARLLNWD